MLSFRCRLEEMHMLINHEIGKKRIIEARVAARERDLTGETGVPQGATRWSYGLPLC